MALGLCTLVARAGGQGAPVFKAETRVVVVQATVRNARGELVTSLDRDAFTVYENNARQTITTFRRDEVPVSVGILIDNSRSMRDKRPSAEAAALAFVQASNPQDEVFVLNFADKPHVDAPFTNDVKVLEAAMTRRDSIGGTALRDALAVAVEYLAKSATRERKVLFLITDGNDNASLTPMDRVKEIAERGSITIYAIGLLNSNNASRANEGRGVLDELTQATGALAYYPDAVEQIGAAALDIAHQIRSQYTLAYIPAEQSLDGSYRKLRVIAKGPERLYVRTRPGYRALPNPRPAG